MTILSIWFFFLFCRKCYNLSALLLCCQHIPNSFPTVFAEHEYNFIALFTPPHLDHDSSVTLTLYLLLCAALCSHHCLVFLLLHSALWATYLLPLHSFFRTFPWALIWCPNYFFSSYIILALHYSPVFIAIQEYSYEFLIPFSFPVTLFSSPKHFSLSCWRTMPHSNCASILKVFYSISEIGHWKATTLRINIWNIISSNQSSLPTLASPSSETSWLWKASDCP